MPGKSFIPHPHFDLSVTRLKNLAAPDIWRIGATVTQQRQKISLVVPTRK